MSDSDNGYEYARPVTIGGAAGTYTLQAPWGPQACEYAVRLISSSGVGGLCIAYDNISAIAVSSTTSTNTTGGYTGELVNFPAATPAPITPSALFALCPNGVLVLTITGASNILVTIHFRRRLQFAYMPEAYHINPDLVPEEAIHAQRARDAVEAEKRFNGR